MTKAIQPGSQDRSQLGFSYFDADLRFVEINDWLAALNGLPPAEHLGRTLGEILPGSGEHLEAQLREVIKTGEPILEGLSYLETAAHPTTKRLYQHDIYPHILDGTVVGVQCLVRDISQQKLVEMAGVIPWEADAKTWAFTYVGLQAEEMVGYPIDRWYESDFWVSCIHPDDRERVIDFCAGASLTRERYEFEYRLIKADGGIVWIRDVVTVESARGVPVILRGFMFEISDLKEAEGSLQAALEDVERLQNQLRAENTYLKREISEAGMGRELVGEDDYMRQLRAMISQVAPTDSTVLILGETGTGKELVARAVHAQSSRAKKALVKVNCATLPATLIESELFGHEKGAFTGAVRQHVGRFELADGGTIFLDEVGELPLELQPKLLRVLQDGEFERLGSSRTMKVDVRVIAATNHDLERAVATREFRKDLFYRLQIFPLYTPLLRNRPTEIPILVSHILGQKGARSGIKSVPDNVMRRLVSYAWPGNVRELENVIERAVILTNGTSLQLEDSFGRSEIGMAGRVETLDAGSVRLEDVEREHIVRVLEECGWRVKGKFNAAERLGLDPSTLRYRLKKLGIERPANGRSKQTP